jgi:spore germination protein GerM
LNLTRARIIAVCVVIAAITVVVVLSTRERSERLLVDEAAVEDIGAGVQSVILSFASRGGGRTVEERREIVVPEDSASRAKRVLEELASGPRGDADGTIPVGTRVLRVFFDDQGGVYVDMSAEFIDNHPGGSTGELYTIRSIVRTLALNFSDVERVFLLVEGEEIETIAGHIDASVPFSVSEYR